MSLDEYITSREAAKKWSISHRRVAYLCEEGRVSGAVKKSKLWLIPINTEKPVDGRYKNGRRSKLEKEE
jgi:hypothetical protein